MNFFEKMFGKNELEKPVNVIEIEKEVANKFAGQMENLGPKAFKALECTAMAFLLAVGAEQAKAGEPSAGKFINETPAQIALHKMVPLKPEDLIKEFYAGKDIRYEDWTYLSESKKYERLAELNKANQVQSAITGEMGGYEIGGDK